MTDDLLAAARRLLGAGVKPLPGGYSGETFAVDTGTGEQLVLRLFVRDPAGAAVTVGLFDLLAGLLPVPQVLDARFPGQARGGPALVLMSRLPGRRLDEVLAVADDDLAGRLGATVARLAGRLAGIPFQGAGQLVGRELQVVPFHPGQGVVEAADRLVQTGFDGDSDGLLAVARDAEELITGATRACLVHSDFNPKNLLVDPATATVTGLVDWEYAHAGAAVTDLGNMLRFDEQPAFAARFTATFLRDAPGLPPEPLATARALDLIALLDLATGHANAPTTVSGQAVALLARTASTRDLAAGRTR